MSALIPAVPSGGKGRKGLAVACESCGQIGALPVVVQGEPFTVCAGCRPLTELDRPAERPEARS